jgi:tetratricopeptide (TPR) repeat protein
MWTFCWIMIFGYLAFVPDLVDRVFIHPTRGAPVTARQAVVVGGCLLCLLLAGCREPENTPAIFHERGRMRLARNQPQAAIDAYRIVLQRTPDNPVAHYDLGVAQARLGDRQAALASYTTALKLNPDYREALVNRADVLNQLGRHAEAAEDCSMAVELSATDVLAWQNFALAQRGLGNIDRAVAALRVALALDPEHPRSRLIDAQLALDRGAPDNALEAYSSLIDRLEREPLQRTLPLPAEHAWLLGTALMGRSAVWESLGDLDRASADRDRARKLNPHVQAPRPIPKAPTPG